MPITLIAKLRDTRLIARARSGIFSVTGGSLLKSTGGGGVVGTSGYVLLSDGGQIILSQEIGVQVLTLTAKERDTRLIAEQRDG